MTEVFFISLISLLSFIFLYSAPSWTHTFNSLFLIQSSICTHLYIHTCSIAPTTSLSCLIITTFPFFYNRSLFSGSFLLPSFPQTLAVKQLFLRTFDTFKNSPASKGEMVSTIWNYERSLKLLPKVISFNWLGVWTQILDKPGLELWLGYSVMCDP